MQLNHSQRRLFSVIACLLLLFLVACSPTTTPHKARVATPTPGITLPINRGITPTSSTITVSMPPTQTDCPPAGTARAMILEPLALGQHHTIIYTHNTGSYDAPSQGTLLRYDVQTGHTTMLFAIPHAHIYGAQVSSDGQWILFLTTTGSTNRQTRLQLLRMDGQGLQTLFCIPGYSIQHMQWSPDQHWLAFYNVVNQQGMVYLLDMQTGKLQTELTTPPQVGLILRTWLDTTHIYLTDTAQDTIFTRVYLLDISRGAHQHLSDLLIVFLHEYGDFDSSYDGSQLLISFGGCRQSVCSGPSSIGVQAITGGPQRTIYASSIYDVIAVRVIDQRSLLFMIGNAFSSTGAPADSSHNGLWKINLDGSGLTRLVPITAQQYSFLNYTTQELWSNVSRDASLYAVQVNGFHGFTEINSLVVGALHGGQPKTFASSSDGSQLAIVGWTRM